MDTIKEFMDVTVLVLANCINDDCASSPTDYELMLCVPDDIIINYITEPIQRNLSKMIIKMAATSDGFIGAFPKKLFNQETNQSQCIINCNLDGAVDDDYNIPNWMTFIMTMIYNDYNYFNNVSFTTTDTTTVTLITQPDTNKSEYAFKIKLNNFKIKIEKKISNNDESDVLSGIVSTINTTTDYFSNTNGHICNDNDYNTNSTNCVNIINLKCDDYNYLNKDFIIINKTNVIFEDEQKPNEKKSHSSSSRNLNKTKTNKFNSLRFDDLLNYVANEKIILKKFISSNLELNKLIPRIGGLFGGGEGSLNNGGTSGWGSPPAAVQQNPQNNGTWGTANSQPPPQNWGQNQTTGGQIVGGPPTTQQQRDNNSNKTIPTTQQQQQVTPPTQAVGAPTVNPNNGNNWNKQQQPINPTQPIPVTNNNVVTGELHFFFYCFVTFNS